MNKKILKISLLSLTFFVLCFSIPHTTLADRKASVTIDPTTASIAESVTYTYTITNANDGLTTAGIGSIEIQLPSGF